MVAIALISALPAAATPPSPEMEEEIVVIASKLKDWRASLIDHRGDLRCYTRHSTGDAQIDRIGCNSMLICHARYRDRFDMLKNIRVPTNKRKKLRKTFLKNEFSLCVFETRDAMIVELADKRAAMR